MKNCLRFCMMEQHYAQVKGHPQEVMRNLGIKYKYAIPQSLGDQWWFIDCEYNCELPSYLTVMEFTDEDREHWILEPKRRFNG